MIIEKNLQAVWKKHRNELLKIYGSESKPITHAELVKRFVGLDGKQYYGFNPDMALPLERLGQLRYYMQLISKGLTAQEDDIIDAAILENIELAIKNPKEKAWANITVLINERKKRRNIIIHSELFYNYLAVQLICEDEAVNHFDPDVQLRKVAQFKEIVKKKGRASDFFKVPELSKLNSYLKLPDEQWEQSFQDFPMEQKRFQEILNILASQTLQTRAKKILEIN